MLGDTAKLRICGGDPLGGGAVVVVEVVVGGAVATVVVVLVACGGRANTAGDGVTIATVGVGGATTGVVTCAGGGGGTVVVGDVVVVVVVVDVVVVVLAGVVGGCAVTADDSGGDHGRGDDIVADRAVDGGRCEREHREHDGQSGDHRAGQRDRERSRREPVASTAPARPVASAGGHREAVAVEPVAIGDRRVGPPIAAAAGPRAKRLRQRALTQHRRQGERRSEAGHGQHGRAAPGRLAGLAVVDVPRDALAPEHVEPAVPADEHGGELLAPLPPATRDDDGTDRALQALAHSEQHRVRLGDRNPDRRSELGADQTLAGAQLEQQLIGRVETVGGVAHQRRQLGGHRAGPLGVRIGSGHGIHAALIPEPVERRRAGAPLGAAIDLVPRDRVEPRLDPRRVAKLVEFGRGDAEDLLNDVRCRIPIAQHRGRRVVEPGREAVVQVAQRGPVAAGVVVHEFRVGAGAGL